MKKIHFFSAVLAAGLVAASCGQDTDAPALKDSGDIIVAGIEQPSSTRAKLGEASDPSTFNVVWATSDQISVVGHQPSGEAAITKFSLASGAETNLATFSGTLANAGQAPYYALFPPSNNIRFDNGAIVFDIPERKGAQSGNVTSKSLPMISRIEGTGASQSVGMKNVFGLLKLSLRSESNVTIKKVTIHDLAGNMLWGDCRVPLDADGNPQLDKVTLENGTNSISMVWNSCPAINKTAKSYYFIVPAGAFDRGFSVVVYEKDLNQPDTVGRAYAFLQKVSAPVAVQRSVILDMSAATITDQAERVDVLGRGYYKSLFVDAGYKLSNNYSTSDIPAISYLKLDKDYEYISVSSESYNSTQVAVFAGGVKGQVNWQDDNGALLYPDGEPRFRTMYVNGGRSEDHGTSLTKPGLDAVNKYFSNGGSYVGTCAGSFLAVTYVDGTRRYGCSNSADDCSFGLFPGQLTHTSLPPNISTWPTVYTGMAVLPALQAIGAEYGFKSLSELDTIEDTRHHGGSYYPHISRNKSYKVEELLSFQYSDHHIAKDTSCYTYNNSLTRAKFQKKSGTPIDIVDSVSTWAYKASASSGRLVVTGSHPEKQKTGTQRDFMAFMLKYSMAGNGTPAAKATLTLANPRKMVKNTSDKSPSLTKIGDRQYHHFKFKNDEPIKDFAITIDSDYDAASGIDLWLALRKDDFAWLTDAEYTMCNKGGKKVLSVKELPAGTWYIGVYCPTTVEAVATESDPIIFKYSGRTEVLNGVGYTIRLDKDVTRSSAGNGTKPGSNAYDFDL